MKKTDAAAVAENGRSRQKSALGGTFSCPAWTSEVNFYVLGLKTGYIALLHVIGGDARPRTDSATEKWSQAARRGSPLHAEMNSGNLSFFFPSRAQNDSK